MTKDKEQRRCGRMKNDIDRRRRRPSSTMDWAWAVGQQQQGQGVTSVALSHLRNLGISTRTLSLSCYGVDAAVCFLVSALVLLLLTRSIGYRRADGGGGRWWAVSTSCCCCGVDGSGGGGATKAKQIYYGYNRVFSQIWELFLITKQDSK